MGSLQSTKHHVGNAESFRVLQKKRLFQSTLLAIRNEYQLTSAVAKCSQHANATLNDCPMIKLHVIALQTDQRFKYARIEKLN